MRLIGDFADMTKECESCGGIIRCGEEQYSVPGEEDEDYPLLVCYSCWAFFEKHKGDI